MSWKAIINNSCYCSNRLNHTVAPHPLELSNYQFCTLYATVRVHILVKLFSATLLAYLDSNTECFLCCFVLFRSCQSFRPVSSVLNSSTVIRAVCLSCMISFVHQYTWRQPLQNSVASKSHMSYNKFQLYFVRGL